VPMVVLVSPAMPVSFADIEPLRRGLAGRSPEPVVLLRDLLRYNDRILSHRAKCVSKVFRSVIDHPSNPPMGFISRQVHFRSFA